MSSIKEAPRASGPPTIRPGNSPGGGFRSIQSSELSKIPSSPRAESFKSVRPHTTLKLENKLAPKPKTENPFKSFQKIEPNRLVEIPKTRSSFETIKPITKEIKAPEIIAKTPKGSQRYARTEVPDVFKKAFEKSSEATLNPTKAKVPEAFYKAFEQIEKPKFEPTKLEKPETRTKRTQLIEALKDQKAPLAEISRKTRRESIASLMKNQQISLGEALKQDVPPTRARTELIKGLLENKSVSLQDALKKEVPIETKKIEAVNDKRKLVADLLKDNGASLTEVFQKEALEKAVPDLVAKSPNKARREMIKGLLKDQKVSLADIVETKIKNNLAEVSALKQELPKVELKNMISVKTVEQNLEVVRKVLTENKQSPELKLDQTILTELIKQPNIIDFQKAKELIEQKQDKKTEVPKIETHSQVIKTLEVIKTQNQTEVIKPNNTPQIEATLKVLQQPENLNIEPEKRAEAIALLKEVANTKEYVANPKLQEQIKAVVKKEQERVIEEQAMQKTAQAMTEAGIEPEIIAQRLEAVVETKNLPFNKEQIEIMLQKAETKMLEFPKLIAENGELVKEEQDEYELMLMQIQELLIELDEKTLENRFKAIFAAFDKSWIKAQEEGKEYVDGYQLLENLEIPRTRVLDSLIVRPFDQTDGTLVETTKDIQNMGNFDNLDQARQALSNILLNHLPGKASNQPTTQQLTDQQIKEIFYGGKYPSNLGKPFVGVSLAA